MDTDDRTRGTLFRLLPLLPAGLILALVATAAFASSWVRGPKAQATACEPQSWMDWHVAVRSRCVTRAYVCHNMTAPMLMRDPKVAEAYEDALASNDRERIGEMDALIDRIRAAYGCAGSSNRAPAGDPREGLEGGLPPGHPPVHVPGTGPEGAPWPDRSI